MAGADLVLLGLREPSCPHANFARSDETCRYNEAHETGVELDWKEPKVKAFRNARSGSGGNPAWPTGESAESCEPHSV